MQKRISKMTLVKKQIQKTVEILSKQYPLRGAMDLNSAYKTIVGVILSARTRDEQVLKLLPDLFKQFPTVHDLASASEIDIEAKIDSIGMYRQKSKNLKNMAQQVVDVYGGEIPNSIEELITLAGVGRKTASVVLSVVFDKPAIAVDTHVHRVANRLGWVKSSESKETESKLLEITPDEIKSELNRVFVKHGRYICISRPRCWGCPVSDLCKFAEKNFEKPKNADAIISDVARREEKIQELKSKIDLV